MKKIISIFLCLIFSFECFGVSASSFSDTVDENMEIEFLAESGVVMGRTFGVYAPDEFVNRAEMIKILLSAKDVDPDGEIYKDCFSDVKDEWFSRYVCYAKEEGIVSGYDDGTFRPASSVNLAEALKMAFNVFNVEFDSGGGDEWYSPFVDGGEAYFVFEDAYSPSDYISRRAMAEIAVRVSVVALTGEKFNPWVLRKIMGWGKKIQALTDADAVSVKENLDGFDEGEDGWILKIASSDGNLFEIKFSHKDESFISEGGVQSLSLMPVIEIEAGTGIADIGLNSDFSWDGVVSPFERSALVDADLYGFFDSSVNLEFYPDEKMVYIYSELKEKSGSFNLETGEVIGDLEITKGVKNLSDYFSGSNGVPFSVCVSDGLGKTGEVGIFDDYETVGVRKCRYGKDEELEPLVIKPVLPYLGKFGFLVGGGGKGVGGGHGGGSGGGLSGADGAGGGVLIGGNYGRDDSDDDNSVDDDYDDDNSVDDDYDDDNSVDDDYGDDDSDGGSNGSYEGGGGVTSSPEGSSEPDPYEIFPKPEGSLGGGYDNPTESADDAEGEFEAEEKNQEEYEKAVDFDETSYEKGINDLAELINARGLNFPEVPSIDVSECCPDWVEKRTCCDDLDFSTAEGRAEYQKRLKCLTGMEDALYKELAKLLVDINFWFNRVASLEKAELAFAHLELFSEMEKKLLRIAIDVVTGDESGFVKGVLSPIISEIFGDDFADAFNIGYDTSGENVKKTLKGAVKRKIEEFAADVSGFKAKVEKVARKIAEKLQMGESEANAFVEDITERFGERPTNLFKPGEWLKALSDALMNAVSGPAKDFMNTVSKLREKLEGDLIKAWEITQQLKQLNDILKQVVKNCGKSFVAALKERFKKLKEIEDAYSKGLKRDGGYIEKAIRWVLNNEIFDLWGDGVDSAKLKELILARLQKLLCGLGFDLCWIDIDFDIECKVVITRGVKKITCTYTNLTVEKRDCKLEPCPCLDDSGAGDDSDGVDDGDVDVSDGDVDVSDENVDVSDEDVDVSDGDVDVSDEDVNDEEDSGDDFFDDYCESCYCSNLTVETFVTEILGDVYYDYDSGYVLETDCNLMIPDSYVFDKFAEFYGNENSVYVWEYFTSDENLGLLFNFKDGAFWNEEQQRYVNPLVY